MAFNGIKYIKNVTKSFGYAMVDVVGEMNPVINSFSEANGDLGKELYQTVKDYKGTAKKIKKSVMESDVYEFAKNYKRNLFDDLKTGKFYNKERIDSLAEKISGMDDDTLNAEFSDMFSDDDEDISFDDWDKDTLRSDMFMAEHIDDVGAKISDANAEVTIRSAEYMANVQKETAKALYAQNNKLFGQALQGMAAINANVGQLVGMPELMQVHTNNASTFFEKTSGQLDQITTLLDTLVKNTTPSDEEAQKRQDDNPDLSFRDIFTSKGMPNLKKYFQYAKKNIANNSGELAMLGDLFGNGTSMLQAFAASPLESIMKASIKQLIPTVLKSSMDQFNDTLQGFFGSAITKLNRADSYDNPVLGFIQKIFGIQPDLKTDFDTARYEKGKVNWDGVSRKALVEVIPGQLAKIASALTGEDPLIFNPDTGKMESVGRINDRANGRLQDAANSAGYNVRRQINQIMSNGKIRFGSKAEQDKWEDDLDAFFMNIFQNGGLTDKDIKGHGLSDLGVNGFNADLLKRILGIMSKSKKGKSTLLDLNRRVLSGIDQYTAQMNDMEAKGSVDNALYNGMFENFIERYNSDETRSARNATGIKNIISARERSSFSAQTDEYGHNIFYYLQGIFQRQDAIYENSSYMVENWGSGGGKGRRKSKGSADKGVRASFKDIVKNNDILTLEDQIEDHEKKNEEWYRDSLNREKKDDSDILVGISKKNLDEMELNNDVAEYRDRYNKEHDKDNKTLVDKMLEEKTLSGKFGVLMNGSKSFFRKPLEGIAKMFDSANDSMYNLIYGEKPSDELKDMGFIGVVKQNIQGTFDKMNSWMDEHILNPLKEKFGIENRDDFFRKLFGVFDKDYDAFKDKMKEGVFGTKGEDGRRSGGLLGDYVQDVKDNAKGAFNWAKEGFKDVGGRFFGGGSGEGALDHWSKGDLAHYATGGTVQKTGIAAVSKGELIIPSELNPYYHGSTNKAQQIRDENQAVRNFFGSYAKGGHVKDQEEFEYVIEDVRNYINNAGVEISDDELKKYLAQVMIDQKLQDTVDKNGNPVSKLNERVKYLVGKARGYIKKKELTHRRKQLTGQKVQIVDYNEETGEYMTNDGYIGNAKNLKNGRHITKNKQTGGYDMREKPESFIGDMVLNLAKAAKAVHHSFVDGDNSSKNGDQNTAFDDVIDDVTGNFKSYAGAMTVGGGIGAAVSALTGMVGGPLVGAAVGSAVGLTMKSDKVQNWLFGEVGEDGRQGGVFSKETSKFITEKVPTIAKFGMVGGAAGTIMGHPMIGTLIGSAVGLAQKSETFGNIMFNGVDKDGNKHKGLFNMTQEQFNEKVKTKLPRVAAGALAGALTTPLPFGFLPNIMLGSAIGFASDTEKFKTKMFGAIGKDGERHGGIVGAFRDEFIRPLGDFIKDQTSGLKDWLENDIMKPMTDSVQPLAKQIGLFAKGLMHPIKWLMGRGTKTDSWFQRTLEGRGLAGKVYKAGKSVASNVADASIGLAKGTIGILPQMIGAAGARARYKQITRGNADYMTAQERLDYRNEHNNVEGFKDDWKDVGNTFASGWNNIRTKGKRLSGIGNMLSGVAKTGISFGKIGTHLINGAGRGLDEGINSFRDADQWIANATVDEKKQMRTLLINTVDAQKGKNERIKNLQRDLDANIRSNTFSLLTPRDREKFISKVKKDGNSLDDLREFLAGCKTKNGKKLTDQQIDEIMGTIEEGVTELRRLQGLKNDEDLKHEKDAAIAKLNGLRDSDGNKYGWLAQAMKGGAFHKKNAEKLLSMLNYDIDMDDQYNEQQSDEDKSADQAAQDALKHEEEHNEVMDLGKIIANLLAATAGMEQPYNDVKKFTKNDKVKDGSSEDINADENTKSKSTDNAERSPLLEEAENRLNPEKLKEDTDHPEQQQEVPATAFGGFIKKAGKAVLHAGEFVVKNGSSVLDKAKEFFGDGEDETAEEGEEETEQPSSRPAKFKGSRAIANVQQASPVAGMFNDDSTAAHVGNYLPGQIVWIADRRYKYDGESQELIPDNDTAKQYEANRKKAFANANGGSGATTEPDQQEAKDASDDVKTLDSLFQSMGLGGGIGKLLGGLKNLSWVPSLAGPLALISFFSGKLDPMLGNVVDAITKKLGFSDSDAANFSLHGTDGEEGYSDRVKGRIGRNALSLINPKGGSNLVKTISKGFTNAGDKLLKKNRLRKKAGGAISKLAGKGFGLFGRGLGAIEDTIEYGADKINQKVMNAAAGGKFGNKIKSFVGSHFTPDELTQWTNKGGSGGVLGAGKGLIGRIKDLKSGSAIITSDGAIKLPKMVTESLSDTADNGARGIKGLFGKAKKAVKSGVGGIKSALGSLKDSKASKSIVNGLKDAADSGSDEAKKEATDKLKDWLANLVSKGKIDQEFLDHADELADGIMNLGKEAGKNATRTGTKKTFVGTLKSMGPVGWATTLVMAVADFTSGYQDANSILGISDATTSEKVIAGLLKSIKGVIEGIIACVPGIGTALSIGLSLIPEKSIVTLFVKIFKNVLSPVKKLDKKRKEMTKKVNAYNKKTGKKYDTEQYLKTVNNDKTIFEKAGGSIKAGFHNLGVKITGKGKKINTKKNRDSGYDEDGNFIEGYLNKSTKRWKGYYAKAINKGVISSDYAEALYMNECLHDSALKLDKKRKADYEQRIADFQKANPGKTIPSISTDLKGLINKGSVSGTGGLFDIGAQKKGSVEYGGGKTSQDFVGKFATGGLIQKSGLAALSKGELRTTPANFARQIARSIKSKVGDGLSDIKSSATSLLEKIPGVSSIIKLIGGIKSKGSDKIKDYEDLTDLGTFVKDIQSLDPAKTEWKDYWAKLDAGVKLKGTLGTLKKALYRIAATMFMPTFAMGKALDSVNGSLSSQMSTNKSSNSSSSSSNTSDSASSSSSGGEKKQGFLSKVVGSVKNLFGKLFGKGSGLYGGASAITDGSFISQLGSKDQYGDSSYAEEGCAPATAAMLINQVNGNQMTMEEAGKYALSRGYKVKGDGTKEGFFKDIFSSKGIASESVGDQNAVIKNLKAGKPTIILGQDPSNKSKKNSPFGKNPHYVLATGVDKKGNIIVNDPEAKRGGKRYKPNILAKMKSAISTKAAGGHSGLRKLYGGGDVASQVWYFLKQNGFSEQAAAGVMGNLKQETNMNPSTEVSGVTCGIACWDYQNGKNPLKEAASKAGVDWKDLGFQLNYLLQGLPYAFKAYTGKGKHYYSTGEWCWWPDKMTFDEFKVLTSVNDAAEIFERVYERASKPLIEKRKKYANEYYTQFTGKEGEPVSYTGSSDTGDSSSTGDSATSFIDSAFKDAMNNTYGSTLLSSLTSAGLFSGFGDEDTNVSDGSDTTTGSSTTATVTTADGASVSSSTTIGQEVATDSANYVGNKYVYGGNDLNNGIDCSGFVQQLYKKHGYNVAARRAIDQFNDSTHGTTIKGGTYNDLKPGDAMYFSNNGKASGIHHTGIYVGNGHMIHAQSTKTGVVDTDLSKSSYYQGQYIGAKRFGSGSGMAKIEPSVSGILSNAFKSSKKATSSIAKSQTKQIGSGVANVIGSLARGSNGSMSLDNLVDSIEKIAKLLQSIADNTEPIAQICKLITGMNDDNKEAKKKQEAASKTTRKSMSVGSNSKERYQSSNSSDILQLLTAFSQV